MTDSPRAAGRLTEQKIYSRGSINRSLNFKPISEAGPHHRPDYKKLNNAVDDWHSVKLFLIFLLFSESTENAEIETRLPGPNEQQKTAKLKTKEKWVTMMICIETSAVIFTLR